MDDKKKIKTGAAAFVIPFWSDGEKKYLTYLEHALESVYDQTDDNWRVFIVDDNSDCVKSKRFLEKVNGKEGKKVTVRFCPKNLGPGNARNVGIGMARESGAPFVCFMDADDMSSSNRVEETRRSFFADPKLSVLYSGIKVIDEHEKPVARHRLVGGIKKIVEDNERHPLQGYETWIEVATKRDTLTIPSALSVRTELAQRHPFPVHVRFHEDTHTWLRYSASGAKIGFLPGVFSKYRIPSETSGSQSRDRAGGRAVFNRLRAEVIMEGLDEAIAMAVNRKKITAETGMEIKVRYLLNLIALLKDEGTPDVERHLLVEAKKISGEVYEKYKNVYDIAQTLHENKSVYCPGNAS